MNRTKNNPFSTHLTVTSRSKWTHFSLMLLGPAISDYRPEEHLRKAINEIFDSFGGIDHLTFSKSPSVDGETFSVYATFTIAGIDLSDHAFRRALSRALIEYATKKIPSHTLNWTTAWSDYAGHIVINFYPRPVIDGLTISDKPAISPFRGGQATCVKCNNSSSGSAFSFISASNTDSTLCTASCPRGEEHIHRRCGICGAWSAEWPADKK